MSGQFARAYLGIGEVLVELRAEFPDISVSKIRFLESEGLITPARSPSGYRRFGPADVDQLRFILTAQRDQYLPLRVIKERLHHDAAKAAGDPKVVREPGSSDRTEMVGRRDLMESAGRKEIGMMVPLVFGVLPLTVVFAVFPGLAAISLGL